MIEEIGMMSRVGEWVLEKSMREFLGLMDDITQSGHQDFYLGVNVSRHQLSDPFFSERLDKIFDTHRL